MQNGQGNNRDMISVYNPVDGSLFGTVQAGTAHDVDEAVRETGDAFLSWSRTDPPERSKILFSAAGRIRADQKNLATLLTREQ